LSGSLGRLAVLACLIAVLSGCSAPPPDVAAADTVRQFFALLGEGRLSEAAKHVVRPSGARARIDALLVEMADEIIVSLPARESRPTIAYEVTQTEVRGEFARVSFTRHGMQGGEGYLSLQQINGNWKIVLLGECGPSHGLTCGLYGGSHSL
jgi:hypothetical protein